MSIPHHVTHPNHSAGQRALLLSALPTGTGPCMLAEFYGREASRVSRVVLLSTLGSLITLSACLVLLPV